MSPAFPVLLGVAIASQPLGPAAPPQPGTVRVAVVNVGYVFNNWERAQKFKTDLEKAAGPYNDKAAAARKNIASWQAAVDAGDFKVASKAEYEKKITIAKRALEDLAADMRSKLGKQSEDNLVALWQESQEAIRDYATKNGIELVFGFGDPLDKGLMDLFPNVNRKMNAMDGGSAVPLFIARRADISEAVTEMLNRRFRGEKDAARAVPQLPAGPIGLPPPAPPDGAGVVWKKATGDDLPRAHTINSRRFDLPVRMTPECQRELREVRLYVKTPKTEWRLQESVSPYAEKFACRVPEDGEYWYLLVTVDRRGQTDPPDIMKSVPNQRVVVRTKPEASADPAETARGNGSADTRIRSSAYPDLTPLAGWAAKRSTPANTLLERGHARWREGEFDKAIADFSEAIRMSPNDATTYLIRGHALNHRRDYDKAIADYSSAIQLEPKEWVAFMGRANAYYRLGKFEAALADLDTVARLDPMNVEAFMARGMVCYAGGQLDRAIAEIDAALKLDPRCRDANFMRGRFWRAKGDLAKAIADFDAALRLQPGDPDIHFERGVAHGELGDYRKAAADFTRYIEARPKEGRGYGMRAIAHFTLGDAAQGWADAAKAHELDEKAAD